MGELCCLPSQYECSQFSYPFVFSSILSYCRLRMKNEQADAGRDG